MYAVLKSLRITLDAIGHSLELREPMIIIATTRRRDHWFALSGEMRRDDCRDVDVKRRLKNKLVEMLHPGFGDVERQCALSERIKKKLLFQVIRG